MKPSARHGPVFGGIALLALIGASLWLAAGWPSLPPAGAATVPATEALYLPSVLRLATATPTITPTPTRTPTPTATPTPLPTATPERSGYALNGGFEQVDNQNPYIAAFWGNWWLESPKPGDGSYSYAYKPNNMDRECLSGGASPAFVHSGDCAQRARNFYDPWWGGVYQSVAAPAGQRVRLTAYGHAFAANVNYPAPSDRNVHVKMQVGLEPNGNCGGGYPAAPPGSVIWSAAIEPHDTWQSASVEAVAGSGGRVCVFLSTDYRGYSRMVLVGSWDAVSLVAAP